MQKLNDQILECLGSGSIFARDELRLDANYDSVGRVLNALVKERKVVRVGRGRYRLASGNTPISAATISEQIERRIARSKRNVFLRGDFGEFGSYDSVGRALRQMVSSGKLIQIGYGLYAKAALSPFSGKSAPLVGIKRLAVEALGRLGKKVEPSSFERSYNAGRSTQVPTGRTLAVKDRFTRRIGYDGNYVVLERA